MKRVTWLRLAESFIRKDFHNFSKLLLKRSYSDEYAYGFLIDQLRETHLESRFISKKTFKREVETPFGETIEQELVNYETTKFRLSNDGPGIELTNPPRSTATFLNQLSLATNFEISISKIDLDLKKWVSEISKEIGFQPNIKSLECKGIALSKDLTGSLSVSGSGPIESEIERLIGKKKHTLKKIKIEINGTSIVLTNNASAKISTNDDESLITAMRKTIPISSI